MSESKLNKSKVEDITLTLEKLVGMENALGTLAQCKKLTPRVSYRLSRLILSLKPEFETFNEARNALIKKYGTESENGQTVVAKENIESYNAAIKELLATEISFKAVRMSVDAVEVAELSPFDFAALDALIIDPDEEDEDEALAA